MEHGTTSFMTLLALHHMTSPASHPFSAGMHVTARRFGYQQASRVPPALAPYQSGIFCGTAGLSSGSSFSGCVETSSYKSATSDCWRTLSTPMSHHTHRSALTIPELVDREQSEPSDISSALDVEQLDTNLFRSKSLYLPYRARGVFGGQVISQSLVAATKSAKPEFSLHVSSSGRLFVLILFGEVALHPSVVTRMSLSLLVDWYQSLTMETSATSFWVFLQLCPFFIMLIDSGKASRMLLA